MKFNKTAIRSISATLVLAQLSLAMQPLMAATREDKGASSQLAQVQLKQMRALQRNMDEARASKAQAAQSPADRASAQLARIEELVRDLDDLRGQLSGESVVDSSTREQERAIGPMMKAKVRPLTADQKTQLQNRRDALGNELRGLLAKQTDDQAAVRAEFAQNRQMLIDRKLPQVIMQRHDDAVRDFEQRVAQFNRSLSSLSANSEAAAAEMKDFFDQYPTTRRAAPVDPKNLPWRTPEPTKRMPAETQTAWFQNLYGREGTRLAQTGNNLEGLTFITPPEPGTAPTAADLAETPETQRTPAIVAKAKELGNNPVNIQNWVRNNVEWVPTWGAIQSAQDTLDKKRGNAIDIASLQIALLRAAKIPARYQFGTVELPAEQVMNWVGGVSKPEAAQQLLGQGGIANRGLIEGGKISKIRMEHAWVQTYVNWIPSRGAKQGGVAQHVSPYGARNSWIPMDGSYKQYSYKNKIEGQNFPVFDAAALVGAIKQGATTNEAEGSVQNVNSSVIAEALNSYVSDVQRYIESQSSSASIGDVVGEKFLDGRSINTLLPNLSYVVVQAGLTAAALPDSLRNYFVYELFVDSRAMAFGDSLLTFRVPVSELSGRRVTILYVPAERADADMLASFLPKARSDGGEVAIEAYPKQLPGYLVNMRAQIRVDGAVKSDSVVPLNMGASLIGRGGFVFGGSSDLTVAESHVVGQTSTLGLSLGGVSSAQLQTTQAELLKLKSRVAIGDLAGISGESVGGAVLNAASNIWFSSSESNSRLMQRVFNIVEFPGLSYGFLHAKVRPVYSWGVVRRVDFTGVGFDIPHVRSVAWAKSGVASEWVSYNSFRGQYMSSLENNVPERFFQDDEACRVNQAACLRGASAMSAIGAASQQGQKIFSIRANDYSLNPSFYDGLLFEVGSDVRQRIKASLISGNDVVVHQKPVRIGLWSGVGYVATNPETGGGGYIIQGGSNGGDVEGDFGTRYLSWVNDHMITNGSALGASALLAPFLTVTKELFGFRPLLGSANLYTTVLRGLAVLYGLKGLSAFAAAVGPFLTYPALALIIFIGFYNLTILVEGLFYARRRDDGDDRSFAALDTSRRTWVGAPGVATT